MNNSSRIGSGANMSAHLDQQEALAEARAQEILERTNAFEQGISNHRPPGSISSSRIEDAVEFSTRAQRDFEQNFERAQRLQSEHEGVFKKFDKKTPKSTLQKVASLPGAIYRGTANALGSVPGAVVSGASNAAGAASTGASYAAETVSNSAHRVYDAGAYAAGRLRDALLTQTESGSSSNARYTAVLLEERGEKLGELGEKTKQLNNAAADFAANAEALRKRMENNK